MRSLTSISHVSLISNLNCNLFEALDSWLPKLQNHVWFVLKISWKIGPILSWIQHHCAICSLYNLASINYNSLILTSNYDPFEALDFWLSNLQNHMWFDSKNSWEVIFDFKLKMMKLGCQGSQIKNFQESFFSFKSP